jgi:16S rRNA (adenine1518-N6/adenine1519-N6)-dimethyltransferase
MAQRLIRVKEILRRVGLHPKKSWSQNFLVDLDVIDAIAEATTCENRPVVELGAGFGALTQALKNGARRVVAVERDRDFAAFLRSEFGLEPTVEILEANAATLDWPALAKRLGEPPVVVGNLPYHMATPILFHLLSHRAVLAHWVLMFQREMAERLVAGPGCREYGVLSVLVQRKAEVETVLDVGPGAFHPAPKVHSRVLRFTPLAAPRVAVRDEAFFERVVKGAFSQRRKKIRNSLLGSVGKTLGAPAVDRALAAAGIDPGARAEQLSLECFAVLTARLQDEGKGAGLPSTPGA